MEDLKVVGCFGKNLVEDKLPVSGPDVVVEQVAIENVYDGGVFVFFLLLERVYDRVCSASVFGHVVEFFFDEGTNTHTDFERELILVFLGLSFGLKCSLGRLLEQPLIAGGWSCASSQLHAVDGLVQGRVCCLMLEFRVFLSFECQI